MIFAESYFPGAISVQGTIPFNVVLPVVLLVGLLLVVAQVLEEHAILQARQESAKAPAKAAQLALIRKPPSAIN